MSAACHTLSLSSVLLVLLMTRAATAQDKKLPDFIKVCHRNDPELNSCITNSVKELQPILEKGVEGFIPSLEPLFMREILITEGSGFKITGNQVNTYGCSNFKVSNMRANIEDLDFEFDLDLPLLYTEATYDVSGRILLIPIKGNGPFSGNWTNCKAHVKLTGEFAEEGAEKFPSFNGLKIDFQVGQGSVMLKNLFGGDKVLGDAVNSAVNANFKQVLNELRKPIETALEEALLEIANDCVRGFTLEQLAPMQ